MWKFSVQSVKGRTHLLENPPKLTLYTLGSPLGPFHPHAIDQPNPTDDQMIIIHGQTLSESLKKIEETTKSQPADDKDTHGVITSAHITDLWHLRWKIGHSVICPVVNAGCHILHPSVYQK